MKKSKYQQYFHYFIVCILGPYAFWIDFQQNIVTTLISAAFRGEAYIRGRCLFQYRYQWCGAYLRRSAFQRRYGIYFINTFLMYCTAEKNYRFFSFLKIIIFFINTSLMYCTAETSHSYSFFQKDHPVSRNTGNKTSFLLIIYVSLYRL